MYLSNFALPPARCDTRSILKQSTAGLNWAFPFSKINCYTKSKEPNLFGYLSLEEEHVDSHLFPGHLALIEIKIALSRVWTWFTKSVFLPQKP